MSCHKTSYLFMQNMYLLLNNTTADCYMYHGTFCNLVVGHIMPMTSSSIQDVIEQLGSEVTYHMVM